MKSLLRNFKIVESTQTPIINFFLLICLALLSISLTNHKEAESSQNQNSTKPFPVKIDSLNIFDSGRNRLIPVAFYFPDTKKVLSKQKVIIFNHGYGGNNAVSNKAYSYLTEFLASQGYFVASIQHELPTDEPLAMTGKLLETRKPNWERGVQNILYVINELKKSKPSLDYKQLTLIGHSNGGDMIMLFAQEYPALVDKVISLDNRRMPLPRVKHPQIYSLRSSDQIADEGVLPTIEEQQKFGMKIIKLNNTAHNEMDDGANDAQRKQINNYIFDFLRE
jgi:predicted esterase